MDFGLAMKNPTAVARAPVGQGTRPYMAPEVLVDSGLPTDLTKIDVYAFGCVLWEMLSGNMPWESLFRDECDGDHAKWRQRITENVVGGERPQMDVAWPQDLRQLMQACWADDPDARPTMTDVELQLTGSIFGGSRGSSAAEKTQKMRKQKEADERTMKEVEEKARVEGELARCPRAQVEYLTAALPGADRRTVLAQIREAAALFKEGMELILQSDSRGAECLRRAASAGHAAAAAHLAVLCLSDGGGGNYFDAESARPDATQAKKWGRMALEQLKLAQHAASGDAEAQLGLGFLHFHGVGTGKDQRQAVVWVRRSAEQRNMYAEDFLGGMYAQGAGVGKDLSQAVTWTLKSAKQGHSNAQCNLGSMYCNGSGVRRDRAEAAQWFHKAAANGNTTAAYYLQEMF
jgi:TPR repeat protein